MNDMHTQTAALTKVEPLTLQEFFTLAGVPEAFDYASEILVTPNGDPSNTPFKHQVGDLNQALANERFGLYNEPSVGKTLPAQAYCMYQAGLGNRVVVVMPPVLIEQFTESFDLTFPGYEKFFTLKVLNEGPQKRRALFDQWREDGGWPDILCMTYQMFSKIPRAKIDKKTGEILEEPNPDDFVAGVLKKYGYCVYVADEAHALKSGTSSTFKTTEHFLGQKGDSACVLMTGTPIGNTLLDAYGLIQLINPGKYSSKRAFERYHCIYQESESGHAKLVGFKNKLILTANLYANSRRITKDMVFSPKVPIIREIAVHLSKKHLDLYKKLVRERFLELEDGEIINAIKAQALRQKCLQMITCPHLFTNDRIPNMVLEMVDELLNDIGIYQDKVVLYAHYRKSVEFLAERYKEYNPALIYGGASDNTKEKNKFLEDDSCRLLIANVVSGGVGLNLQSVCSTAVFVEPVSVPGQFKQAMERLRVGHPSQKKVVSVYILKALGTLAPKLTRSMLQKEQDTLAVLQDRQSLLNELMGL